MPRPYFFFASPASVFPSAEPATFTNGSPMLYGRGMPRPKAAVSFFRRNSFLYQWVAACRDHTFSSLPQLPFFLPLNQRPSLIGRQCCTVAACRDPKQQFLSSAEIVSFINGSRHAAAKQSLHSHSPLLSCTLRKNVLPLAD